MTATDPGAGDHDVAIELLWIPVGAGVGTGLVRHGSALWERVQARREHRPPAPLHHAALVVHLDTEVHAVEMGPAWDPALRGLSADARGVVVTGPVGSRLLGHLRGFRYELRRRPDGIVPDASSAVARVAVPTDATRAREVLARCADVPDLVWGRDEAGLGDMWNSNSIVAWLLAVTGHPAADLTPPSGRAPGWAAGIALAGAPTSPGWTDGNDRDPGITLVQVLPFVAAGLALVAGAAWYRRRGVGVVHQSLLRSTAAEGSP